MNRSGVSLSEAIEALRKEILIAASVGQNEPMRFALEPIELTMQMSVTKDLNGKAGWKILEVNAKHEHVAIQTLVVRLTPLWKKRNGEMTRDFSIASDADNNNFNIGFHPNED